MNDENRSARQQLIQALAVSEEFLFLGFKGELTDDGEFSEGADVSTVASISPHIAGILMYEFLSRRPEVWRSMRVQEEGTRLSGVREWTFADELMFGLQMVNEGRIEEIEMGDRQRDIIVEIAHLLEKLNE